MSQVNPAAERPDRNDLRFWYPRLRGLEGVVTPRTEIITTTADLWLLLDGRLPEGFEAFLAQLGEAPQLIGYPVFLRTGHTSGKHRWRGTCFLERPEDLAAHVVNLVEYTAMADIPVATIASWAVREFVPMVAPFTAFDGLPIAPERRWFVRDGEVLCSHPYWPTDSIRNPSVPEAHARRLLLDLNEFTGDRVELAKMRPAVERVAAAFDGGWSVDFCLAKTGVWYLIDMAEMDRSWHWPGCWFGGEKGD
jgi:ATP-grasp domain, R2K clade family 3